MTAREFFLRDGRQLGAVVLFQAGTEKYPINYEASDDLTHIQPVAQELRFAWWGENVESETSLWNPVNYTLKRDSIPSPLFVLSF